MAKLAGDAVRAGSLGFSTSRTLNHRTSEGKPTPTLTASEEELTGIAQGMAEVGAGVVQVVSDFSDPEAEFAMLRRIVERTGRPLSFSLLQSAGPMQEGWRTLLAGLERAKADGLPMRAQAAARAVGVLLGFELTLNPFSFHPSYRAIASAPLHERVALMRQDEFRARLLSEQPIASPWTRRLTAWDAISVLGEQPDYEPGPADMIGAAAARRGTPPSALALDAMLARDGKGMLYLPFLNYSDGSLDPAHAMLSHECCVPGLSDGGAHVGMICDGSFPTTLLSFWTRDRARGPRLRLEDVVRAQSRDTARLVGLLDRGEIRPGQRADLNLIDYDRLRLLAPEVRYDLPAGGRRLVQRAEGYRASFVGGVATFRDGEPTGAKPGRLVRGPGARPA